MIRLEEITKRYGLVNALNGVSICIQSGELIAVQGASGSGKSTLMNLIGLLDRPSSGRLEIAGADMSTLTRAEASRMRNLIHGFVFQSFQLIGRLTAWENVALPLLYRGVERSERRKLSLATLNVVGLSNRANHRPGQLSGGQCQRVAIARALVGSPRLILADEPTGSLDSNTAKDIMKILTDINIELGVTTIIVTHDLSIASLCRRTIEVSDGRVVTCG